jgi:hypothetical protein
LAVAPGEARAADFRWQPKYQPCCAEWVSAAEADETDGDSAGLLYPESVGQLKAAPVVSFTQDPAIRSWPRALLPAPLMPNVGPVQVPWLVWPNTQFAIVYRPE